MKGQVIGYVRVSSHDQNPDRQLEGMEFDRKFIDKFTGKVLDRPSLNEMMQYVREGDHVYVHSMDRLARNLMDLRKVVSQLTAKKVKIQFIKENLIFTGDDSPMSVLLLSMMGAFAEFELSLNKERQREGIRLARERGIYVGRKKMLSKDQIKELHKMCNEGRKKTEVAKKFNMSREAVYKYLRLEKI
jgi:DNA invertase Pin-like site-specific DNA recombinase